MNRPALTVLIDTYNHERFIEATILSVLEQDFPASDREILVVDDGSTDRTPEIVHKFEPRIRMIRKANGGQASAFNAGIPEARGAIVTFLDGDDSWAKQKLSVVAAAFEQNAGIGAVGHGFFVIDAAGKIQSTVLPEKMVELDVTSESGARLFSQLRCFLGTSRIAYRKSILERILPVPEGAVIEADEHLFTLGLCVAGAIILPQPLCNYRLHEGNLYMIQQDDDRRLRRKYESLVCLLQNLPPRMEALHISPEIKRIMLEPLAVEVQAHRLQLDGGSRWEMFCVERAGARIAYRHAPIGYRLFKYLVLGLTLIFPARQFLRIKRWYSEKGLRNLRRWIGEPVPAAPISEQRSAKSNLGGA
ncbi:MAG: glycosyltransferase family 2 protein [Candidatus Acidiferrales bacterium]